MSYNGPLNPQDVDNWLSCKGVSFGPPSMSADAKNMAKQREKARRAADWKKQAAELNRFYSVANPGK